MALLTFGVVLWAAAHFFKRLIPGLRARMGNAGKGVVALVLLAAIVMMVWGYRAAPVVPVYHPLPGMGHLNNALMIVALYLLGAGSAGGRIGSQIRHPMLWGVVVWAIAHLLVNGDEASLVLFGGLGTWALVQMLVINRATGPWQRPAPGTWAKDIKVLGIALVLYALIAVIHIWLGHNPFLGTYS